MRRGEDALGGSVKEQGCSGRRPRIKILCANGVLDMVDGGEVGVLLPRRDQVGRVRSWAVLCAFILCSHCHLFFLCMEEGRVLVGWSQWGVLCFAFPSVG